MAGRKFSTYIEVLGKGMTEHFDKIEDYFFLEGLLKLETKWFAILSLALCIDYSGDYVEKCNNPLFLKSASILFNVPL